MSSNDQEWILRPECRELDDHSPDKHCQFAVVTNVARPDVVTTKPILYELVRAFFEPTSFGSKFLFSSAFS